MECKKCNFGESKIYPFARRVEEEQPIPKVEYYCTNLKCEDYRDVKDPLK